MTVRGRSDIRPTSTKGRDTWPTRQEVPGRGEAGRPRARLLAGRGGRARRSRRATSASTRRSRRTSTWAWTRATPTRWSAARSSCPTAPARVVRVAVFAQGDKAQEALRAGADEVGAEDLVKKIEAGWLEFDVALATPDMMGQVGRLGKILGRRGLMPNPKSGTITFDLDRAIREVKAGRVEFKVDKGGLIHVAAGKGSFEADAARRQPGHAAGRHQPRAGRPGAKGQYLQGLTIASTMGPGIKVDIPALLARGRRPRHAAREQARRSARLQVSAATRHTTRRGGHLARRATTEERTAADSLRPRAAHEPKGGDGRGLIRRTGSADPEGEPGTTASTPRQGTRSCTCRWVSAPAPRRTVGSRAAGSPRASGRARRNWRCTCQQRPSARRSPSCATEIVAHRTFIVSEYRGLKVSEIAEIRRSLRKQDVTYHVVKNRLMRIAAEGTDRRGAVAAARRPDGDRLRDRRGGDREGRPRRDAAVLRIVKIKGGVLGAQGDRRRRRHAAGGAPAARACSRRGWPARSSRRSPPSPGCCRPTCATWPTGCSSSPTRRQPRGLTASGTLHAHRPPHVARTQGVPRTWQH